MTEGEKIAELEANFGPGHKPEDCDLVCDDCYEKFLAGFGKEGRR